MRNELTPYDTERAHELSLGWLMPGLPAAYARSMSKEDAVIASGGLEAVAHLGALRKCLEGLSPSSVLDVGAGLGRLKGQLESIGVTGEYTGVDLSDEFVAASGGKVVSGDAADLPFEDGSFGLVISNYCLIHIFDWRKAIAEAARVSSGPVILHRISFWRHGYTGRGEVGAYGANVLFNCFAWKDFDAAVRAAGLVVEKMVPIGRPSPDGISHHSALCVRAA